MFVTGAVGDHPPTCLQLRKKNKRTHRADCANTTSMLWSADVTNRRLEKNCEDARIERFEANKWIDSEAVRVCITGLFASSRKLCENALTGSLKGDRKQEQDPASHEVALRLQVHRQPAGRKQEAKKGISQP